MADAIPARLNHGEARRFGLVVGAMFLALGALQWWRARPTSALVLGALGAALLAFGIVFPGALVPVRRAWMGMAAGLSKVTTPVFMGVVYFGVLTPTGVALRLFGRSPLKSQASGRSRWVARDARARKAEQMLHQF